MSYGFNRLNSPICHLPSIFSFHLYIYFDYGKWSCHGHSYENILRKYLHRKTSSNVIIANCRFILIKIKKEVTSRDAMIILECPHSLNLFVKGRLAIALLNYLCFGWLQESLTLFLGKINYGSLRFCRD